MKNLVNEVTIKLLGKSRNESFARSAVSAFVMQMDPTLDELNDIKTAVSEAVTNSIVHGYKDEMGIVYINIKILESNTIILTIKDSGCGIADITKAREPLFTTGDSDRSGMGFTIMESFMDKILVSSKLNKGTTIKMYKTLKQKYEFRKNG